MSEQTIRPCPFCGSTAVGCLPIPRGSTGFTWVSCYSCDSDGPVEATREAAIAAWNRRTDDELRQAVRELLGAGAELTSDSSPREAVTEIRRTQDVLERLRQLVGEQS